jgi:hypothetical protein
MGCAGGMYDGEGCAGAVYDGDDEEYGGEEMVDC